MRDLRDIPQGGLEWLHAGGPHAEIVLSTRVRLARNLQGLRFGPRARSADRSTVLQRVTAAADATDALGTGSVIDIGAANEQTRQVLVERHLASRELVGGEKGTPSPHAALLLAPDQSVGVMVNEEDHLRLQSLLGGFRLREAWRLADELDEEFATHLPYAFHPEFGFLTSCPTNAGTGLRASVLMHLPALVLTQEITKVLQGIAQVGLTFRGLHGEGSEVVGNFFQISNQTTLGKTEEDLIDHLQKIVQQVVQYELQARAVLLRDAPAVMEDKVWRAYGLLRHARSLSFQELMNLLSGVRLGVGLKLLPALRVYTLNEIMIFTQPAHLERAAERGPSPGEVDVRRAAYVRRTLAREEGPSPEEGGEHPS